MYYGPGSDVRACLLWGRGYAQCWSYPDVIEDKGKAKAPFSAKEFSKLHVQQFCAWVDCLSGYWALPSVKFFPILPCSRPGQRYVRKAGLKPKLHFHSLRHTFATWLVQAGVSLYEVQKLLGHSNISATQIYAHLAASELHGAVNKISIDLTPTGMLPGPEPAP